MADIRLDPSKSRLDDEIFSSFFLANQSVHSYIEDCGMDLTFVQVPKLTELWQAEDGQDLVAHLLAFLVKILINLNKQRHVF